MKIPVPTMPQRFALVLVFLLLCGLSAISLFEAAASRAVWLDEFFGIQVGAVHVTWRNLFVIGPNAQGSPHPLYYVLEKLWLTPWSHSPQRWWNLNLFFRLLPITYYSLAGGAIFLWSQAFFGRLWPRAGFSSRVLVAAALALFFYNVQFAEYYAIEARPYSLWLLLSTVHLLLTLDGFDRGWQGRGYRIAYGAVSLLLCSTASPGIFQLGASFMAIQMRHRRPRTWLVLVAPVLVSAYYMFSSQKWGYPPGSVLDYLGFMKEVAYKSFHARNAFAFAPVMLLACWKLWSLRRSPVARPLYFYLACLFALTFVLYLACWYKGFLLASRQYIYLVPVYLLLYFIALLAAADFLSARLKKWLPSIEPRWILGIWAAVIVAKSAPEMVRRAFSLPGAAAKWSFYGENTSEECTRFLAMPNEHEFESLNRRCRRL